MSSEWDPDANSLSEEVIDNKKEVKD